MVKTPRTAVNEYAGYKPEPGAEIDVIEAHKIEPKEFWAQFIALRKPVRVRRQLRRMCVMWLHSLCMV